ncbi:MAG: rhomboid family intramembrane serine protease [Actinomycetota bacterium]|jgi:membrane associated rhomboid family serine protease|nr:rhomboid family intramembrane serine protease [Actinomycetota bacterium]
MALLPIHDDNPTRRRPWVTYALIAVNVVVFFASPLSPVALMAPGSSLAQACEVEAFLDEWAAVPAEVVEGEPAPAVVTGQPVQPDGCAVAEPTYEKSPELSVLTAMFLHGGIAHLAGNMLFLFVFGNNVEDRLGRLRFLLYYLATGYAATYAFAIAFADSTENLVGASGAVAGVLGGYLLLFPRARVLSLVTFLLFLPLRLPAWVVLGSWFLLQYLYASGAGLVADAQVAYLAHVAGFLAGVVLVLPFVPGTRRAQAEARARAYARHGAWGERELGPPYGGGYPAPYAGGDPWGRPAPSRGRRWTSRW